MNKRPFNRYKYYVQGNKVHAVSKYAGKTVRATAICSPNDEFDIGIGMGVAGRKCNIKVAEKRVRHAEQRLTEARAAHDAAVEELCAAYDYYDNAIDQAADAMNDFYDYIGEVDNAED